VRRAYTDDLIAQFAADKIVVRFGSAALVEAAEQKLKGGMVSPSAITEAIDGLFGGPDGDNLDVIALACTHFPLLTAELAAAAPRACAWLDSGAAIARRLAQVLAAAPGKTLVGRAGFTDLLAARALFPAFHARGFDSFAAISAAPLFEASNITN
jgi:glutamate racemase